MVATIPTLVPIWIVIGATYERYYDLKVKFDNEEQFYCRFENNDS